MTEIELLPASQLTDRDWRAWADIVADDSTFDSPFFHPQFTRVVASVRDDVEVAVLRDGSSPVGFFPFQRDPNNVAQAVSGRLSEFHGVIARSDVQWRPEELLKKCGLAAWHFDHLPASQKPFQERVWGRSTSPFMDLSDGFEAYRAACKVSGSAIKQTERKARKLAREQGPLRFEFHTADAAAFQKLIQWKAAQHERTGMLSVFHYDWVPQMLERVRKTSENGFEGVFSVLYAGETVVAVHLGIRSRTALHMWFPAYDPEFGKYSVGTVLLLEMAKEAANCGVQRIDLGRGDERYKQSFKSDDIEIWEGSVDNRPAVRAARHAWYGTKRWIRTSRWGSVLQTPLEASKRLRQRLAFR